MTSGHGKKKDPPELGMTDAELKAVKKAKARKAKKARANK